MNQSGAAEIAAISQTLARIDALGRAVDATLLKDPAAAADKYVDARAGSDIQPNPPATNEAVERLNKAYVRTVDRMPARSVLNEIEEKVDLVELERVLMKEGTSKFAEAQKTLLRQIDGKRASLQSNAAPPSTATQGATATRPGSIQDVHS